MSLIHLHYKGCPMSSFGDRKIEKLSFLGLQTNIFSKEEKKLDEMKDKRNALYIW